MNGFLKFLLEAALCIDTQERIALSPDMPMMVAEKYELQEQQRRLSEELSYQQNFGESTRNSSEISEALAKIERRLSHHE